MLSLAVPLLFMSLLGFKLKLPYGLLMGLIILTLLLGWLGNVSLLPVLVVLFLYVSALAGDKTSAMAEHIVRCWLLVAPTSAIRDVKSAMTMS